MLKSSTFSLFHHCNFLLAFSTYITLDSLLMIFLENASLTFIVGSSFCLKLFPLYICLDKTFLYLSKSLFLCHLARLKLTHLIPTPAIMSPLIQFVFSLFHRIYHFLMYIASSYLLSLWFIICISPRS